MRHLDIMYLIVTACKHVSMDLRTKETIKLGDQRGFFLKGRSKGYYSIKALKATL